jgi:hypothetical protein
MPNYGSPYSTTLLYENQQKFFWNQETVATGNLSIAFEIYRVSRSHYPWGLSVEVTFSGAPGAFEVDIMGANSDLLANYVQLGNITTANATNVGRWDMPTNMWPKFIAAYLKTLTNAVSITCAVTR